MTKPRILFIGGVGRSGSTLLERILGETPGVVCAGEVYLYWRNRYSRRSFCSCGQPQSECPFWDEVTARVEAEAGPTDPPAEQAAQYRVASYRDVPLLPWQPWHSKGYAAALDRFATTRERLYRAIAEVSGSEVIVDSSKVPRFALAMAESGRTDLRVLHLVRDSRAGAYSWVRPKKAPTPDNPDGLMDARPIRTVATWFMISNPLTELLRLKRTPYLRVKYEDFVRKPVRWIGEILDFAGVSARPPGLTDDAVTLTTAHTIAGNPIRLQTGPMAIRPDDAWKKEMRPRDRRIVTAITWPLLLRYGYPLRVRP